MCGSLVKAVDTKRVSCILQLSPVCGCDKMGASEVRVCVCVCVREIDSFYYFFWKEMVGQGT